MELLSLRDKPEKFFSGPVFHEENAMSNDKSMFEGRNIHSSKIDGKLLCSYSEKLCMQRRLNGFAFCIRHILEDKGAPFKQCRFFAKYNKSRCINPVPILEKRNYCNSHMQVLGMIPKKLKKKKDCEKCPATNTNKECKPKEIKQIKPNHNNNEKRQIFENRSIQSARNEHNLSKNSHRPSNKSKNNVKLNVKADKKLFDAMMMPPLEWPPHNSMWKRLLDKRKGSNPVAGNIRNSSIERLKNLFHECDEESQELFESYMFEKVENDHSECEEVPWQADTVADHLLLVDDFSQDEIRNRLMHQSAQLKHSIKTRLQDKKMTYTVLNALISAAKTNAAATANALNTDHKHKNFRNRRLSNPNMKCVADVMPNVKCPRKALPYSRHCSKHVGDDADQVLFGKCTAKFAAGPQCAVPVIDLVNERPLCDEHSLKMIISAKKDAAAPPSKRSKKPEKFERSKPKQVLPKRNLKAQLQKKFAIPNKPKRKANSHITVSSAEEKEFMESKDDSVTKQRRVNKWEVGKAKLESEDESMIIAPRGYEAVDANGPSSNELPFDIDGSSLSSPSLSEDEGAYPLMNMGRSHQDSFTFDDDEDMMRSTGFDMRGISDPRCVTSPTLMQLSTEPIPSTLSLGALCSPPKSSIDKSLFDSSLPLRRGSPSPTFKRFFNHVSFDSHATEPGRTNQTRPPRLIGNLKNDSFASKLLLNSYGAIGSSQSTNSVATNHVTPNSLNAASSNNSTWSKYTLSNRNDQTLNPSGGFIRVGPSQNSIYSPPFTSPSPRSKSSVFKFDNAKVLENDLILPRNPPPPYSTVVQQDKSNEKRYEAEPPFEKVNPDIFLSTMFTDSSSS